MQDINLLQNTALIAIQDNILNSINNNELLKAIIFNLKKYFTSHLDYDSTNAIIELCSYLCSTNNFTYYKHINNFYSLRRFKRGGECVSYTDEQYVYKFYNIRRCNAARVLLRLIYLNYYFKNCFDSEFLGIYKNRLVVKQKYVQGIINYSREMLSWFFKDHGFYIIDYNLFYNKYIICHDICENNIVYNENMNTFFIYDMNVIIYNINNINQMI